MSPFEIGVILHYHCRVGDHEIVTRPPPIGPSTLDWFLKEELLRPTRDDEQHIDHPAVFSITPRGRAYVEALQALPLPVQVWVIPERTEAIQR